MALNFWETRDVEFKYDTGLPLQSREEIVDQVLDPKTRTFNAFSIGTDERNVTLGDTITAQFGYSYGPLEDAITNYFRYDESNRDQDYDPFADMEGFEDMSDYLKDAVNAEHMAELKKQLLANERRRKVLSYSSFGSQLVAGIFDPINLVAIPFGGFTLSATKAAFRTGRGVALITAGQETLRYPVDPLATGKEVAANIGMSFVGGAVLGGLIGGVVSKRISKTLDELEEDAKFFDDLSKSPERTGPTVADQDIKPKTKKQKIRTENDLDKKDAQDHLKEADENTIIGFEKDLPKKIIKIEEELVNKQADPRARDLDNLKPLYQSRERLEKQLQKDAGQSKVLIEQNNRLLNSIENTAKFVNDVKSAAAKFAEPLKRIKDDLLAQARGERKNVGLSPKQVNLLESIKAKEAQQFFTAKQKASINKSLKTIKEIQNKINRNIAILKSKKQGNEKFLGDTKRKQIRDEINKLTDIISHNNSIITLIKDKQDVTSRYDKIKTELNRREVNEFATLDADGKRVDGFKLPPNFYTDSVIYKGLVTPIKKAFQSKILPEISKYKFFKLGADLANDLVANKLGKTFGQSVNTKSGVRHGEYAQAHDQLRGLYSEHTGKNQVYLDYDFQKKGYHEWLEDTYKRILKDEPLTELDKKVKTVVDKFMERWEKRLRDVGIIGDIPNLEKSIIQKSERIIQYTKKLKDVTARGSNDEQFQIARTLEQDALSLLTGSRKQEIYIPIRKLTGQQLIERFFTDAKMFYGCCWHIYPTPSLEH